MLLHHTDAEVYAHHIVKRSRTDDGGTLSYGWLYERAAVRRMRPWLARQVRPFAYSESAIDLTALTSFARDTMTALFLGGQAAKTWRFGAGDAIVLGANADDDRLGLFTLTHCIVDECEVDEAQEEGIEFLEAREDPPEALEPPEQALDLVAPLVFLPVVHPRIAPGLERRNHGSEAEVERQLACFVALVGAVHHQRRAGAGTTSALATETTQQLASLRCVVRLWDLPTGGEREDHGRPGIRGNHMKLGGPAAAGSTDGLRAVFF